ARELGVDVTQLVGTGPGGRITLADVERSTEVVDRSALIRTVTRSHQEIPAFWVERSVDLESLLSFKDSLGEAAPGGSKPTVTDFVIQAVADALQRHPR